MSAPVFGGPCRPAVCRRPVTTRQLETLRWIACGFTAQQAAARMGVSVNTVNRSLALAYRNLGAHTGPHAVALAMARGLIRPEEITDPRNAA